jgi:hypothetical protein
MAPPPSPAVPPGSDEGVVVVGNDEVVVELDDDVWVEVGADVVGSDNIVNANEPTSHRAAYERAAG